MTGTDYINIRPIEIIYILNYEPWFILKMFELTTQARKAPISLDRGHFYGRCQEGIGRHNVKMSSCLSIYLSICPSICHVTFSRPLIGQKWECYIVQEVIDVDELDEGYLISAAAGKQGN